MASDLAIVELTEELELYQVLLQSLDDDGRGSDTERQELLNTIKSLESRLEQRRLEQTGMRQAPPPSPSSPSSQSSAYSSVSPVLQKDLSRNSPAFPRWGSSAMPAPAPQSRPAQPSNGYSHLPSHTGRKRAPENAGLLDTPGHTPKRVASFGSPGPSRRQSAATDDSDELWRALGIDSRESFTEFQDAQKNAEQWLEGRREEERRDAEYARRLQDNLLASPRPDLAQSGSTSYSGSNVFNGLDSPVPRSGPTGPGPLARNPFSGIPPLSSVTGRANGLSNPPLPPASNPVAHPARHPAEERLRSVSPWNSDGESDLAEITSADFQRRVYNPPFAPLMDRPNPDFGAFPPPYPSWAPAIGPSGRPGPGPLYGPNVLQSTMARLNASRGAMGGYLGSTPGIFDMMGFDPDGLYTVGPLDYLSETLARDSKKTNEEIKQLLETIRPDSDIESREGTPDALLYPLLEHQKLGLSWMKTMEESEKKGGILADDMGLGKTIQAIALMVSRPSTNTERRPTLIIAPVSLMQQWKREIERMLRPGRYQLSVYILHGGSQKRGACYSDLKGYDVVLTTYGTLASELKRKEEYEKEEQTGRNAAQSLASIHRLPVLGTSSKWHRVILDEAQCIKNRNTKSAQAACCLNATYRWCMSGTPMMNNVEELHSLLKFLRIRPYCALEKFGADFTRPLKNPGSSTYEKAMKQLQVLLKAVLLRRTKTSTIDGKPILQLPGRTTEEVHAIFNEDEQEFYSSLEARTQAQFNRYLDAGSVGRNYSSILVLLLRLRQACCHPHLIQDFSCDVVTNTNDLVENAKAFGPQVIARLKDNDDLECPICFDAADNPIIFFPCGHSTCAECFSRISDPALSVRQGVDGNSAVKCPNCRGPVDPKKITDHSTFKKVHFPDPCDEQPEEPQKADDSDGGSDDDNLSDFVVDDEGGDRSKSEKGKMPKKPKKTLAQLKKEGSKNQKAKRKYLRRLEKTFVSSAKIDKTIEILERIQNEGNGEKTIIFSQFTSLLDLLEIPINRKDWGYRRYDGSMKPVDRNSAVMEFTDNPNCKIMLVSLKAGNSGLNLVAASQVIIFDPFWNPYVEEQAIDRAHRIGQMREVKIHRILVQQTVEDRILELQEKKRELVEGALDEKAGKSISRLGTTELAYLFGVNN